MDCSLVWCTWQISEGRDHERKHFLGKLDSILQTGEAVKRLSNVRHMPARVLGQGLSLSISPPPHKHPRPGRHGKAGRTAQEWGGGLLQTSPRSIAGGSTPDTWGRGGGEGWCG